MIILYQYRAFFIIYNLTQLDTGRHGHNINNNINNACVYSHYANLLSRSTINILLKFLILYFNNFILLRPKIWM